MQLMIYGVGVRWLGFRGMDSLGFRVWGLGSRVWGLGLREEHVHLAREAFGV